MQSNIDAEGAILPATESRLDVTAIRFPAVPSRRILRRIITDSGCRSENELANLACDVHPNLLGRLARNEKMYPETVLRILLSVETAILVCCVVVHYLTLLSIA